MAALKQVCSANAQPDEAATSQCCHKAWANNNYFAIIMRSEHREALLQINTENYYTVQLYEKKHYA